MSARLEHHQLPRDGVDLHYWTAGEPTASPVVLVHGAAFDHRTWGGQVEPLVAAGHRVVLPDVRAHGRSRPAPPFAVADAVDDLLALLDALGSGPATLVGQSMGGNLAQEVVRRAPERVRAFVALGCTCNTLGISRGERLLGRLGLAAVRWYPRRAYRRQVADGTAVTPAARALIAEMIAPMPPAEAAAVTGALLANVRDQPDYRTPVPLLLVRGAEDRLGNIATAMAAWAARDGAREVVLPAAGHAANQDQPEAFNRIVLEFLAGLPAAAASAAPLRR